MKKGSILQDDIILIVYVPNNRVPNYVRQNLIELQRKRDESTIMVGEFYTTLSEMDRFSRQKNSKDIAELNYTINYLDIKLLLPTTAEYNSPGTFTKTDYILDHKSP